MYQGKVKRFVNMSNGDEKHVVIVLTRFITKGIIGYICYLICLVCFFEIRL